MRRIHTMRQRFFFKSFFQNLLLLLAPILLIGPFSIWELNMESRSALKKSSYNVLYQVDETMNTLLSELDNVYYYIRSNPSITTSLKAAYSEPEITLNSLRSINNISSLLRYYMYTSCLLYTSRPRHTLGNVDSDGAPWGKCRYIQTATQTGEIEEQ